MKFCYTYGICRVAAGYW